MSAILKPSPCASNAAATYRALYEPLANAIPAASEREAAADFLRGCLHKATLVSDTLPNEGAELVQWVESGMRSVHLAYEEYLRSRHGGGPRHYFSNRAHALYFLRQVAPTKLVDGSWLYGLCAYADNPRFSDLVLTYLEELGSGEHDKNHVTLYRGLLSRYGLDPLDDLPDALYEQGLIQLALGWNAQEFLPEIIGFNLAYEQLPLHLLICAYELNELGIDPYYFTLHVTVDNADTGHARRACQAAVDAAPRMDDGGEYWRRVRAGAKLGDLGIGTVEVIRSFRIEEEVHRIFMRKAPAGNGAHSDFCQVAGRKVNDWLSDPQAIPAFLLALENAGWIKRGRPAHESRFWNLLVGGRAEMFGVFSPYELQVIHDWIRGNASEDGQQYDAVPSAESPGGEGPKRQVSFRVAERLRHAQRGTEAGMSRQWLDTDLSLLRARLRESMPDERRDLLLQAMSPSLHWTPAGLLATQMFIDGAFAP